MIEELVSQAIQHTLRDEEVQIDNNNGTIIVSRLGSLSIRVTDILIDDMKVKVHMACYDENATLRINLILHTDTQFLVSTVIDAVTQLLRW